MACKGDSSQMCGGPAALSLWGVASKANLKREVVGQEEQQEIRAHMKRHERRVRMSPLKKGVF